MTGRILIVGRLQERIDTLIGQLAERGITNVEGTSDFERVQQRVQSGEIAAVAIGAGIDDEVRLPFAERLREAAPGVEVHVKPDRTGGPGGMIPFVLGVAGKTARE